MTERVVNGLEVVEIDEQCRNRRLAASRTREHLLYTIQDEGPVRQPGQRVVGRKERKLLLAPLEIFICSLALHLKALAHPKNAELQAQLQQVQGLGESVGRNVQLHGALTQHLGHHIAPPVTAPGYLIQRRRAASRQLGEDLPRLPAGLNGNLNTLPRDPAGHRDRRAVADPLKALLNHGVDIVIRPRGARDRQLEHIRGSRLQLLTETMKILLGLHHRNRGRCRDPPLLHPA